MDEVKMLPLKSGSWALMMLPCST